MPNQVAGRCERLGAVIRVSACIVVSLAAVVACTPQNVGGKASVAASPAATASPAFTSSETATSLSYRDGKATLSPAPSQSTPTTSAADAYATVIAVAPDMKQASSAQAIYGLWTDTSVGPIDANGNVQPRYVNVPVWLLHFTNATIIPQGPPSAQMPATLSGDVYFLVRDSDGKLLARFSEASVP